MFEWIIMSKSSFLPVVLSLCLSSGCNSAMFCAK